MKTAPVWEYVVCLLSNTVREEEVRELEKQIWPTIDDFSIEIEGESERIVTVVEGADSSAGAAPM